MEIFFGLMEIILLILLVFHGAHSTLNVDMSGTGSTQPREDNCVATCLRSSGYN